MTESFAMLCLLVAYGLLYCKSIVSSLLQYRSERFMHQQINRNKRKKKKSIQVIVDAGADSQLLTHTIASFVRSKYRAKRLIVMTNNDQAKTRQVTRDFIQKYPNIDIRLKSVRRVLAQTPAARRATKNSELEIRLSAGDIIHRQHFIYMHCFYADDRNSRLIVPTVQIHAMKSIDDVWGYFKGIFMQHALRSQPALLRNFRLKQASTGARTVRPVEGAVDCSWKVMPYNIATHTKTSPSFMLPAPVVMSCVALAMSITIKSPVLYALNIIGLSIFVLFCITESVGRHESVRMPLHLIPVASVVTMYGLVNHVSRWMLNGFVRAQAYASLFYINHVRLFSHISK